MDKHIPHTHLQLGNELFVLANLHNGMFLGGRRKPVNPEETYRDHAQKLKTDSNLKRGKCF